MKRHTFQSNDLFTAAWALFHAAIVLAFLVSLLMGAGIRIDADLFGMVPDTLHTSDGPHSSSSLRETDRLREADRLLSQNSSRNVFILVSHADFESAKGMAERVYEELSAHAGLFSSLSLSVDLGAASELEDFIYANRYRLLAAAEADEILSSDAGAESFAGRALMTAYGGFSLASLGRLQTDPFLLTDTEMRSYMAAVQDSGTALSPVDGVLATEYEGGWYVLVRGVLSGEGARLASRSNAVHTIYDVCLPLEKDGYRFVFSGTPFHSYESSLSASREITLISTVSLLLVLCLLVFVFRSPLPIAMSLFAIALSLAVAFCATHCFFGNVQALTLVFGTSLIGCCIDYSLHFFMHWKANLSLSSAGEVRTLLFKGLLFSFISTQVCYVLLFFMPFPLLRQISLFSFTGISSSFLTTLGLYPRFALPEKRTLPRLCLMSGTRLSRAGRAAVCVLLAAALAVLAIRHGSLAVRNDIAGMYRMEGRLKDDSILSYKVMRYSPSSYFIVSGASAEEVLLREEALCRRLPVSYLATSRFIPSHESQARSLAASERLLGMADQQLAMLGQDSAADGLRAEFDREQGRFLEPGGMLPESLEAIVGLLWLGGGEGSFCSVVMPSSVTDEALFQSIAGELEGVHYENKVKGINSSLDWLTSHVLLMFVLAYLLVMAVLKAVYSWKQVLRIALVPLASVLLIAAAFAAAGYAIDFFCTAGMVLVFGLGLDYVIYMTERDRRKESSAIEPAAVFLSFATTELSFGALALSSFVPVRIIGLCIFTGCLAAFLCVCLFCGGPGRENCKDA